jgi:hypothetical protein
LRNFLRRHHSVFPLTVGLPNSGLTYLARVFMEEEACTLLYDYL